MVNSENGPRLSVIAEERSRDVVERDEHFSLLVAFPTLSPTQNTLCSIRFSLFCCLDHDPLGWALDITLDDSSTIDIDVVCSSNVDVENNTLKTSTTP